MDTGQEITARQQALGEALGAYLIIAAATQYIRKIAAAGKITDRQEHMEVLVAAAETLAYGIRLASRWKKRAAARAGPAHQAGESDEESGERFMARVDELARLHLGVHEN